MTSVLCASVACRRVRAEGSAYCDRHGHDRPSCIQVGCDTRVDGGDLCARHTDEWNAAYMANAEYEAARVADPERAAWDDFTDGGLERPGEDEF